jgi:hypothetical protein
LASRKPAAGRKYGNFFDRIAVFRQPDSRRSILKLFECQNCGHLLFFENTRCERCQHVLGYLAERTMLSALDNDGTSAEGNRWRAMAEPGRVFRFCANAAYDACNWLIPDDRSDIFCRACRLNRTIPDLGAPDNLLRWRRLEAAKHRLVYSLLRFGLPLVGKIEDPGRGLAFDFLSESGSMLYETPPVMTGHARGLITIDVAEADDAERERHRQNMVEAYRTLPGHFRHEVGHYYWDRLVRDGVWHNAFREMFGDERLDYAAALERHYAAGPPPDWRAAFISAYASAHPWEDFAETWAHYLHIVDTLETAAAFGLKIDPKTMQNGHRNPEHVAGPGLKMEIGYDPYREDAFDRLMADWLPLTYAVNSLNQSMGQPDLYPFVLAPSVVGKLRFVHGLVRAAAAA